MKKISLNVRMVLFSFVAILLSLFAVQVVYTQLISQIDMSYELKNEENSRNLSRIWQNNLLTQDFITVLNHSERLVGLKLLKGLMIEVMETGIVLEKGERSANKANIVTIPIYFDDELKDETLAILKFHYSGKNQLQLKSEVQRKFKILLCLFICLLGSLFFWFIREVKQSILQSVRSLELYLLDEDLNGFKLEKDKSFLPVYDIVRTVLVEVRDYKSRVEHINREELNLKISKQLAHDIRSPLSALDMSIKSLEFTEPNQKQLVRSAINRIHDIANNLVGKKGSVGNESTVSLSLLTSTLSSIVSEKRTEYRDLNNIDIDFIISNVNYGLFSEIDESELKRIISNLINNSVEAMNKDLGFIQISLKSTSYKNEIIITDNGKGISKENIAKIFDDGVSVDKEDGTGIGLFHARQEITKWNGEIFCESIEGQETKFTISLPKSSPPKSFVESINIKDNAKFVVVDDDSSIHQVWKGRFESVKVDPTRTIMFSDPEKFVSWYERNKDEDTFYFFDYEFLGHEKNGLDLASLVESDKKYLITSRYEESHIKEKCNKDSIGLIDKGMIGFVPVKVVKESNKFILIDDDDLIHMSWKMEAKNNCIELDCYFTVEEFLANCSNYSKNSVIYIDSNLADNLKGEIESEKIYNEGFKEIYLATGYASSDFEKPTWIKEIVGKRASFKKV